MNVLNKKQRLIQNFYKFFFRKGGQTEIENLFKLSLSKLKKAKLNTPLAVVLEAIQKVKPYCEVKSVKIRGSIHRVPIALAKNRQRSLILRWFLENSTKRVEFNFTESFSKEILDTISGVSYSNKSCDDLHKIAENNKIFTQLKF